MKLRILIPCRNEVNAESFAYLCRTMICAADYWRHRFKEQADFAFKVIARAHIVDARCNLLGFALDDGADWVLWLDDDMTPPDDLLERLMRRFDEAPEYDYIGGLAYKKSAPFGPCAFLAPEHEGAPTWIERLPERLQGNVGFMGFACVLGRGAAFRKVYDFAQRKPFVYHNDVGEDSFYFHQARALGQKLAVDTSLVVGHVGTTVYDHRVFDAFRAANPEIEANMSRPT